jgi:CDP-diacylglycerol--glycerol-3-phosphate 3-phosphatidyltransferase
MAMTQAGPPLQRFLDRLIDRGLLWTVPRGLRPNTVTLVRFVLTPVALWLLLTDRGWLGMVVFALAVSTDFVDGAMARTRDQITPLGIVIDPVADKLLIGSVLAVVGWDELVIRVVVVFLGVELLGMLLGLSSPDRRGAPQAANVFGKVKMVVQSVSVVVFLAGELLGNAQVVRVAVVMLWVSLALALASAYMQVRRAGKLARDRSDDRSVGPSGA